MALTYRSTKGSALTITELDGNFQYLTGSAVRSFRPVTASAENFSQSAAISGYFVQVSSSLTCSIQTNAIRPLPIGTETQFFNTSSGGSFLFQTSSGVTTHPVWSEAQWAIQNGKDCIIKKVDTDIWVIYGESGP